MTVQQKNYFKNNWMTLANLMILLTLVWNTGRWQQGVEKDIDVLNTHAKNTTLHMPFDKKIEVFVPRVELDSRLKNIELMLDRIESKINK